MSRVESGGSHLTEALLCLVLKHLLKLGFLILPFGLIDTLSLPFLLHFKLFEAILQASKFQATTSKRAGHKRNSTPSVSGHGLLDYMSIPSCLTPCLEWNTCLHAKGAKLRVHRTGWSLCFLAVLRLFLLRPSADWSPPSSRSIICSTQIS